MKIHFKNDNFDVLLYEKDNQWVVERLDYNNNKIQKIFNTKSEAKSFLKEKGYKVYRIIN